MHRLSCLYSSFGSADYIGEELSILQHSLQCAALAAAEYAGVDDDMVAAALLHDVGHVLGLEAGLEMAMGGCGTANHEEVGAEFLSTLGFNDRVCRLVRNHVSAKRYLCHTDSSYYEQLSVASKTTLSFQGGAMSAAEAGLFDRDPDRGAYISLRSCDERAKEANLVVPPFESYFPILRSCRQLSSADEQQLYVLSPCQLSFYRANAYLKISNLLPCIGLEPGDLQRWVGDVESWDAPDKSTAASYLVHFEQVAGRRQLCRAENFADFHSEIG